jgi:nitric oxide reductase subunit C
MSEATLRNLFIFGTLFFLLVLIWMTYDSLSEVISGRTPQMSEAVIAGKQVWQGKNCNDCHTILGIGGYFAPEMTRVVERRDANWLASLMTDPQAAGADRPAGDLG